MSVLYRPDPINGGFIEVAEPTFGQCACCKEEIPVGRRYVEIEGERYCDECIEGMTRAEILELFDVHFKENRMPEVVWGAGDERL